MSKIAVFDSDSVANLSALQALIASDLAQKYVTSANESYQYFMNATSGDQISDNGGYWIQDNRTSVVLFENVPDDYDFPGNNATDITSITPQTIKEQVFKKAELLVTGNEVQSIKEISTDYQALASDVRLYCDGPLTVTLPLLEDVYDFTNDRAMTLTISSKSGKITIEGKSGEEILGRNSVFILKNDSAVLTTCGECRLIT